MTPEEETTAKFWASLVASIRYGHHDVETEYIDLETGRAVARPTALRVPHGWEPDKIYPVPLAFSEWLGPLPSWGPMPFVHGDEAWIREDVDTSSWPRNTANHDPGDEDSGPDDACWCCHSFVVHGDMGYLRSMVASWLKNTPVER